MFNRDIKVFGRKLFLFCLPLILFFIAVQVFLPLDRRTFRSWETLSTLHLNQVPFYPNRTLKTVEEGDLGHHTDYAIERETVWQTDAYGYRTPELDSAEIDVVIIGDSMIVGTGLSQDAMLTEVLGRQHNITAYPFAPVPLANYFQDGRFAVNPPDVVILSYVERDLNLISLPAFDFDEIRERDWDSADLSPIPPLDVVQDEIAKNFVTLQSYFWSSVKRALNDPANELIVGTDDQTLFFWNALYGRDGDNFNLEGVVQNITDYSNYFASIGVEFYFMPVPDKENIYYDKIPIEFVGNRTVEERRAYFSNIVSGLEENGVQVIDLLPEFVEARENGTLIYQFDDTHWNENGINVAADLIDATLGQDIITSR